MNKKWFSLIVCIIFIVTSFSSLTLGELNSSIKGTDYDEIETSSYIVINNDNAPIISSNLKLEGFDVLHNSTTDNSFELIVTPEELRLLESRGFEPVIISRGRPFVEIQNERQLNTISQVPPGYLDLEEIIDEMYDVENTYPSIAKVYDLTDKYNTSPTYEDRHIYALKISDNVEDDEDEPNFLMVSCHHAREIVTPVIALYAIKQLTSNYGGDPDITAIVDEYELWICPVWNPDGYEHVYYVDNWWRKNRNPCPPGIGVDLNRNYPFGWNSECSGSTDPTSETYKGPSAASEAETQTMIEFTNDRHFAKVIDYHSYGREVLYGYCCHSHPLSSFFSSEAISLSSASGYGGYTRGPSAEGEHYEWQIWSNGSYANLMETHTTFQPDYSSAQAEAELVWPGTVWMLERPISIWGHVKDSITEEPIKASIDITDLTFFNDEIFSSEPNYGRYHLFLPSATYTIEFSSDNYNSQSHEVTVTSSCSIVLVVLLDRLNDPPNKPTIDGPKHARAGVEYDYTFTATDPENDDLEYYISWGDGEIEDWFGPFESGEEVIRSHSWVEQDVYRIKSKVRDVYGDESEWGYLQVTMQKNKNSQSSYFLSFLQMIFQRLVLIK
jgi:hypothetical protein